MKSFFLICLAVCAASFSYSQSDFREGYIITQAGDTLKGWVDYRESSRAFKICHFKTSMNQEPVAYGAGEIRGYGFVNDKFFQSRDVTVKYEPVETVFLEVIIQGTVSLYRFQSYFFVERKGGELTQLVNEKKQIEVNGKKIIQNSNEYRGTLNILLYDCPDTRSQVMTTQLAQKPLTRLIEAYNRCRGDSVVVYKSAKPWLAMRLSAMTGMTFSSLRFSKSGYEYLKGDFDQDFSLLIGASFDILSPRLSERFSFHADVIFHKSTFHKYKRIEGLAFEERNYLTAEVSQIKVPVGLKYTFPERKFTPYVNAGALTTFHLSSKTNRIREYEEDGVLEISRSEPFKVRSGQAGFWIGAGVLRAITDKLTAFGEVRYERTNGIAKGLPPPYPVQRSEVTNFQLLIGIRF